jgi:hypothetical protein
LAQSIRFSVAWQYLILPVTIDLDITFRVGILSFVDNEVGRGLRNSILHRVIRRVIWLFDVNIAICILIVTGSSARS